MEDRNPIESLRGLAVGVALLIVLGSAEPLEGEEPPVASDLFEPGEALALRLEAPWSDLTRRARSGRTRDGILSYTSSAGETVSIAARVVARGKSRLGECTTPMLTLELDSEQVAETIFEGNEVVHLTVQCQVQSAYYQYIVLEYLAYRIYDLVADEALGTRWLSIQYVEPGKARTPKPRATFLVEDIGLAARRLGLKWQLPKSNDAANLDAEARAVFVLFQYLIANTDWSLVVGPRGEPCCHNAAILGARGRQADLVPIPFDLDSAGLVGAEYIEPASGLGIRATRQRLYRGMCDLNEHLPRAIDRFDEVKAELLALFEENEELTPRSRRASVRFVQEFFATANDPRRLEEEILRVCR